jgi:hypothetical protein
MLLHEKNRTGPLDGANDSTVHLSRHPCDAAWENFSMLRDETAEEVRVFVVDGLGVEIETAAGHDTVRATKCGTAFWRFGLHED